MIWVRGSGGGAIGGGDPSIPYGANSASQGILPLVAELAGHFLGGEIEGDLSGGQLVMAQKSLGDLQGTALRMSLPACVHVVRQVPEMGRCYGPEKCQRQGAGTGAEDGQALV
jgi:hypothetical protein